MAEKKRAIINLTDEQYEALRKAADRLGLSVPSFCKVAALEKASD
jgi:uncharacterized protein (DUF1778 family)